MVTWVWQLGFTQLCHKVSKNDFKVSEQLTHFLNSGEVLTRICFRAELDFILIGKQHSHLSSAFLNSGGDKYFSNTTYFIFPQCHNQEWPPPTMLIAEGGKNMGESIFTEKMDCHGTKYTQNQWRHMSESFGLVRSCFRGPPPFGLTLIGLPENFQLDLSYLDLDYLHLDLGSLQKKRPFE